MFKKQYLFCLLLLVFPDTIIAQMPVCGSDILYYHDPPETNNMRIFQLNPSQPIVAGINPVLNTIIPPVGSGGLAISKVLNSTSTGLTFYTTYEGKYFYYNGSTWINTGHNSGMDLSSLAVNIGAGGGYIFAMDVYQRQIWRYDGTGNSTLVLNYSPLGFTADIAVDCNGNFFVLDNSSTTKKLYKYSSAGSLINSYNIINPSGISGGGGGLAIIGNDVYFDTGYDFFHGVINGDNLNVSIIPDNNLLDLKLRDFATCPSPSVNPDTINVARCSNQLPFVWNNQSYAASGIYSVIIAGSGSCDSLVTLNLVVKEPTIMPEVTITICSNDLPYNWNGQVYSAGGTYTQVFPGSNGCDSVLRLNLTVNPVATGVPANVTICPGQVPYNWNGQNYFNSGTYSAILTASNGCDSITTLNLNINSSIPGTSVDAVICKEQLPYMWYGQNYSTAGIYTHTIMSSGGCDSVLVLNLSLDVVNAFAGNDADAIYNIPYQLSGSGGISYQWSPAELLNNPTIQNPITILLNDTTFYLIVTNSAGCKGYDTVRITLLKNGNIYVPAGFTPNGDAINELFRPLGNGIKSLIYFQVFNRWSQQVFETNKLGMGWDGTFKGAPQDQGSYTWILKAIDFNGVTRILRGNVLLLR